MFSNVISFSFQMTMISMGASVTAAVVAIGALAYALTLEGIILTNNQRSLNTCNIVSFLKQILRYLSKLKVH